MNKKIASILIMASAVSMLAACTNNGGESRGNYTGPDDVTEAPDKPSDPTPTEADPDPEPVVEGPAHIFDKEFKNGEVEGQGTHFIRVGRKVYYRVLDAKGLEDTALFGEFLDNEKTGVSSSLWVYDLDDRSYVKLMDIDGVGVMYAGVQGLFISDNWNEISVIDPINKTQTPYVEGQSITDVSDDGTLLMTTDYDSAGCQHGQIYKDGEIICHTAEANSSLAFYGLAGDDMIALYHEDDSDEYKMVSYDNGIMTNLGNLTLPDDVMWAYPELIEYKAEGDQAYITVGYYEGTGHFLSTWDGYSMTAGVKDSLVMLDKEDHDFTSDMTEPKMLIDNGEVSFFNQAANTLGLSNVYYGDLVYYDGPYGATVIKEYCVDDLSYETEWEAELLEGVVLDQTAFIIKGVGHHIPSADIGWRYAYAPVRLEYMAIPFGPDAEKDANGVPEGWDYLDYVAPIHVDSNDVNALAGTDWDLYSYEVEGDYHLAYDDTYMKYLHFEDNGEITLTEENRAQNTTKTYTIKLNDDPGYESEYINYVLDENGKGPENWVMTYLLDGHLEFSVDWLYGDGTFGGANYVFQPHFGG